MCVDAIIDVDKKTPFPEKNYGKGAGESGEDDLFFPIRNSQHAVIASLGVGYFIIRYLHSYFSAPFNLFLVELDVI